VCFPANERLLSAYTRHLVYQSYFPFPALAGDIHGVGCQELNRCQIDEVSAQLLLKGLVFVVHGVMLLVHEMMSMPLPSLKDGCENVPVMDERLKSPRS